MSDQIDVNAIADTLNSKVQLPNGVGQDAVDFVVESKYPTADDPTWYRVYKSGWVEQGGLATSGSSWYTVNLSKTMADTNYSIQVTPQDDDNVATCRTLSDHSTTSFRTIHQVASGTCYSGKKDYWEVKGMGANA